MTDTPFFTRVVRSAAITTAAAAALLMAGCSANFGGTMSGGAAIAGPAIHGTVMGGQQPLTNSRVYLFAADTGSMATYGSAARSVLNAGGSNTQMDSDGNYYVLTADPSGNFNITGDYGDGAGGFNCAPNDQMYILARGGNPGLTAGTNNEAAVLMAALGACSTLTPGNRRIILNEISTVAGVTALQQFMTDATHVAAPSTNQQGLTNAFTTAQLLVDPGNGLPYTTTTTMSYPSDKILTLANVLGSCVNSASPASTTCSSLFSAANTNAVGNTTIGTAPTNTVEAMLLIAKNPAANANAIISLSPSVSAFGGSLTSANDLSLPMAYLGGGLDQASSIGIDADGNAFVANCRISCDSFVPPTAGDDIVRIQPTGVISSIPNGFAGNGSVNQPQGLMLDTNNYVWNTNLANPSASKTTNVTAFDRSGTLLFTTGNVGTTDSFEGIAYDPTNNVAVVADANSNAPAIQTINSDGTYNSQYTATNSTTGDALVAPVGVAVDSNGNYVVTDVGSAANSIQGGVAVFAPSGMLYNGTITKPVGAAYNPTGVAIDASHSIWTSDPTNSQVVTYDFSGTTQQHVLTTTGMKQIYSIAIDGSGNAWVPSCNSSSCAHTANDALFVWSNGGALTTADSNATAAGNGVANAYGLQDASLANPVGVAIDGSGNVWTTSANGGAVTVFVGIASPVVTPLAQAVLSSKLGTRP